MNIFILLLLVLITPLGMADEYYGGIGADLKINHILFREGYGDNLFKSRAIGPSIYGGIKFKNNIGIEVGYEVTKLNPCRRALIPPQFATGVPLPSFIQSVTFESKGKLQGPYISLMGYYPLDIKYPIELIGGIGISSLKGDFERRTIFINSTPKHVIRTLSGPKTVLRLTGGFQYSINDYLKIRATLGWLNTKNMNIIKNDSHPSPFITRVILKDINFYTIGVVWQFK